MEQLDKITEYDLRIARSGLHALLELYEELGVPEGTETAIEELKRVFHKLNIVL